MDLVTMMCVFYFLRYYIIAGLILLIVASALYVWSLKQMGGGG